MMLRGPLRGHQHEEFSQPLTLRSSAAGGASKGDTPHDDLPDGAMIDIDGAAFAVRGNHLLRWSFAGYTERVVRKP